MPSNIKTNSLRAWFLAARPKTLTAALVPVAIANALAFVAAKESLHSFSTTIMGLTLLFAVVMQIMANFINDYVDFIKGERRFAAMAAKFPKEAEELFECCLPVPAYRLARWCSSLYLRLFLCRNSFVNC